ncbi:MAG TPA: flagellar hook-associated protein FlgK [Alphaproteobacteria bacterium]|nr:flagellar hook-associated protein FlgK [Alphaproteobacteria bacterium]
MAGTITLALRTAQSGLLVNQAALNTTANNIANVNTPDYSRKIVNTEQRVVAGAGAGVQISELTRKIDEGLLKSLRMETSDLNALTVQDNFFLRMQDLFGAPADNTSISHLTTDLTASMESLSEDPAKTLQQTDVVRRANELMLKFQSMSETIQELRKQADSGIEKNVAELNKIITSISDLNDQIVSRSSTNLDVSDMKDQRDKYIDKMAKIIDIRYFYRNNGDVVVFSSGGRTLVDSLGVTLKHTAAGTMDSTLTHSEGDIDGIYVGAEIAGNDITNEIKGGEMKGLISLRDDTLPNLQSQLDEMAGTLRDNINKIHNRGAPFPGLQSATGSRNFVSPSTQLMYLDPTGSADDVTIAILDANGDQQSTTTLNTIMTSATFGTALSSRGSSGDWTIDQVASTLQAWLQSAGGANLGSATASVNSSGNFTISLNDTSKYIAFRDETATANGSTNQDAEIGWDANGDTNVDKTVSGFSNFLGLNDMFTDGLADNIWETNVLAKTFSSTAATLSFGDTSGSLGSVSIAAGKTLAQVATTINTANLGVTATVVTDGAGLRLRISNDNGRSTTVTNAAADTLLSSMGMNIANVRVAGTLNVRSDILATPANISRGVMQWNGDLGASGEYFMSAGDDTIAVAMASALTSNNTFAAAGGLAGGNSTFGEYSASILSTNASEAATLKSDITVQTSLTESLQVKSDTIRGVNLDEEMANLILFQQAYSSSARVISTIQKMFDALERIL